MMNKIVLGAVTAVVVGVGAAAGWYFLGKESGPGVMTTGTAPALDCSTIKADVDATLAALPPELKATYSGLECSAQKLLFAELRFGVLGAGGTEEGAVKLSAVVLDNPFAANAKKIFNAASYPAGQAPSAERLALAGHLTAAKVTIGPEAGGGVSFENLDIADLGARQFAKAPPATLAALGTLAPADLADLLQAFSFSSFGFKNVAGGPQGSEPVLHIASIVLSAFDGAKLGGLDVTSVSAKPEAGAAGGVTIGSLSLKGIGVADLATLLSSAGGMASTDAESVKLLLAISADQATLKDFQASGFAGPDDQVKLATVDIQALKSLAFQSVTVQGLEGFSSEADVAFKLGKFTITGVDVGSALQTMAAGGDPDYSKLRIDGYEISDLS
ncbi:hypothetical protein, partial [Zavarzinia sp.]|uniref:hypothetical protein n=1 Tax=Zavarzinia sp. TaxID=2027920 RepID=UPI00356AE87E